jgi:hypothetical protein
MSTDDLALYTTRQLIDELMNRQTFMGVVVHSRDDAKTAHWDGERVFNVRYSPNFGADQTRRLLEVVAEYMDTHIA